MIRANTAENLKAGLQLPLGTHRIRPSYFSSLSDNQDPKGQVRQNIQLHQAVVNRQFTLIPLIVDMQPHLVTIKNKQGETAADWFLEYLNNFLKFEDADVLESLPEEISSGNVEFVENYLKNDGSVKLRFSKGNTLLHLAIEHNQLAIVKLILNHISLQSMSTLLAMENFDGINPKELSVRRNNPEIINFLRDSIIIPIQPSITTVSSKRLVPSIPKHLFKNIEKSTDLLTDLCCASYWILKQSLEMLNKSLETSVIKTLLTRLFNSNNIKSDIIQLKKNIQKMNEFFKKFIEEESVHQKIKLSTEGDEAGWTYRNRDLIYINLSNNKYRIEHLITTLIHEASHLIHSSYDVKYCKKFLNDTWIIDFSTCEKLLDKHDVTIINLTSEMLALLKIQYLLEGTKLPFNNWLAHHNADTFAVAVLGLAALGWNCAEVENSILSIDDDQFLTALSEYSYGRQPTPEPRRRIFLKATKKTPSIPRASSHISTAASSSSPQSPESNLNQKTSANLLMAGIVTTGIGEDGLPVFPPTSPTSPLDLIVATSNNLLETGPSSPPWTS